MAGKRIRLAMRRKAAGYSQDELAERLGVERSTVVRWEAARSEPQPWVRPKLAAAFNIGPDDLDALIHDVGPSTDEPDYLVRFALEQPSSANCLTASTLRERVRELDESYNRSPSTALLGSTGQILGHVRYARERASDAQARKDLLDVEAESATLMGQLVWDVSQRHDHAGAVSYLDQAISASRGADNQFAESYATLRKSFVALYGNRDPHTGRKLAQQAADIAQGCSTALTGLSLLHVAEGYAMSRESTSSERALTQAADKLERVNGADHAARHYTPAKFDRLAGSCYLFLGQPVTAQPYLERTITQLNAKQKSQSIALGNLALSLIRQRKVDEGVAMIHRTIDAVERTRGGGGINLAFAAARELRKWRTEQSVQHATDRLFALMATN